MVSRFWPASAGIRPMQGPEAARITRRDDSVRTHHHQRKRTFDSPQTVRNRSGRVCSREGDQVGSLQYRYSSEKSNLALQLTADFRRIHKIAIVRYSDRAFIRLHQNR